MQVVSRDIAPPHAPEEVSRFAFPEPAQVDLETIFDLHKLLCEVCIGNLVVRICRSINL